MEDSIGLIPPPNVCYIDGDEEIMYKKCNGKNTCSIFVDPADAGDCADSIPYVFIRHTCTNFVTPSIEASTAATGSDTANIFDRSLSSHFETQYEAQPWLTLTLNKSMIVTRVTVHFHDDEKFIDPSKVVVQVTNASDTANESSPINTSGSRTCFKDAWLGMTYNCFNNDANDAIVIFSKVPGALGIKEVVISTVPEFVDIA
ncbi:uncharacterized protein [Lepeophtheirus salmonis]|uniref:uncharacterized protein n=1 Tax=Lepeophtheirus salmonis TaxID=72036 RepID=UPI001AE37D91|nr:uncharacterized protein LOC121115848 [Lepeophtheirus salmonis]